MDRTDFVACALVIVIVTVEGRHPHVPEVIYTAPPQGVSFAQATTASVAINYAAGVFRNHASM